MADELPTPASRKEQYLASIAGDESIVLPEPASRKELYLATIAGMTGVTLPEKPANREEEYLAAIAENGGGGGGGGGGDSGGTEVRFIDYDGTIIKQMSIEEANKLTEMPPFPVHEDIVGVDWTASLETVQTTTKPLDIGALYENAHNKNQTMVKIYPSEGQTITINIYQPKADSVVVDWGDGSATETSQSTGAVSFTHTYNSVDCTKCPYKLTLTPTGTSGVRLGNNQTNNFFNNGTNGIAMPFDVILGANSMLRDYAFARCVGMRTIVIPKGHSLAGDGSYVFQSTSSLRAAIIPSRISPSYMFQNSGVPIVVLPQGISNFQVLPQSTFYGCVNLHYIVLPESVKELGNEAFRNSGIENIVLSNIFTRIATSAFQSCKLTSLTLPDSTTYLGQNSLSYNTAIKEITIPSKVTSISTGWSMGIQIDKVIFKDRATMPSYTYVFLAPSSDWHAPMVIDFTDFTQVPTITTNTFGSNVPAYTKFLVPAALATEWKAADNWSTYANNIVGV
jgi:hypothetical protein